MAFVQAVNMLEFCLQQSIYNMKRLANIVSKSTELVSTSPFQPPCNLPIGGATLGEEVEIQPRCDKTCKCCLSSKVRKSLLGVVVCVCEHSRYQELSILFWSQNKNKYKMEVSFIYYEYMYQWKLSLLLLELRVKVKLLQI